MDRRLVIFIMGAILFLLSCGNRNSMQDSYDFKLLDSVLYAIYDERYVNPTNALAMTDSFQQEGILSQDIADECRAEIYDVMGQPRTALYYAKKCLKSGKLQQEDPSSFYAAHRLLPHICINNLDWDQALTYATATLKLLREDQSNPRLVKIYSTKALSQIGSCQIMLRHVKEGNESFRLACAGMEELARGTNDFNNRYNLFITISNCIECNLAVNDVQTALSWLPELKKAYDLAMNTEGAKEEYKRYSQQCLEMYQALTYAKDGQTKLAEEHYRQFLDLGGVNDQSWLTTIWSYLETTNQWNALSDIADKLDSVRQGTRNEYSMEFLKMELGPAFRAHMKSGHKDKALITANRIVTMLDTVDIRQRKNDAAELAVIYETQEKEAKIAEQTAVLSKQRIIVSAVIVALLLVFLTVFFYFRYRSAKRLAKMQAEKEHMETELSIARDIQLGMIPHTFPPFPDHPEIDLYASMTPAKEVGGDLYDYAIYNNHLYFCVGDVSGKGVPASLFMTTTINLFRVAAQQLLAPADIATQMNNTLSENNENGMFVTMFIAVVDLATGHMDFCNAGHNPPIYGNGNVGGGVFMEMIPNAPLGLWPQLTFEGESFGDISDKPLIIYTDGLNEAENNLHEQFGDDHILQLLKEHPFRSARQTVELMEEEVERHANGAEQSDDLTILCLKLNIIT